MKTLITYLMLTGWALNAEAQGTVLWDEAVNGSLGNSSDSVTLLGVLSAGTNVIHGTVDLWAAPYGYLALEDHGQFQVGIGWQLVSLRFSTERPANIYLAGSFSEWPVWRDVPPGIDLVQKHGQGPLPTGTYRLIMRNDDYTGAWDGSHVPYLVELVTEPVPEPGVLALGGLGLALFALAKRRPRQP
ncbi:MAG: PEP-CTERM sorting domain-containing protein [Verrucomicrobia bacterium]|nr:PEP-CTERM sorting domain-containing protein [Verrucomicrobiota bacterium]